MRSQTIEDRIYEAEVELGHEESRRGKYTLRHLYLGRKEWDELQASGYLVRHQGWPFAPEAGEVARVYGLRVYVVGSPSHFFAAGSM